MPDQCTICQEITGSHGMCGPCWGEIEFFTPPWCKVCGFPLPNVTCDLCYRCAQNSFSFKMARSLMSYNQGSKDILLRLKYKGQTHIAPVISKWLKHFYKLHFPQDVQVIVPVPLHYRRLMRRLYNQASLIGADIAKTCNIPLVHALKRRRFVQTQGKLSFKERYENVRDNFICRKSVKGKHVLLIDDIFVTGATLDACSQALLDGGASSVSCITLARTRDTRAGRQYL